MITDEELSAIVDNYCRQIRKICDEAIEKVAKISKIADRINEIKSIQQAQKTTGEEWWKNHGFCWICRRNRLHKRMVELTRAEDELKEVR